MLTPAALPGQGGQWLVPPDTLNKARLWGLIAGQTAAYTGTMVLLNEYWYKDYPRGHFRFFDDSREWLQMDKAGHVFNGYFMAHWSGRMYRWSGMEPKRAALAGGATAWLMLAGIEVLDGFSEKWGASWHDLTANTIGVGFATAQELAWGEQRLLFKISAWPQNYPPDLQPRARQLYGNTVAELVLKDYNALTVWLSGNVASFLPQESRFPKWLNIAVGYSADGLFGGFANRWCDDPLIDPADCPNYRLTDRSDVPRLRQFYLAPDIDLSRIPSRSSYVRTLLGALNVIKVPAPALMVDESGKVRVFVVFF